MLLDSNPPIVTSIPDAALLKHFVCKEQPQFLKQHVNSVFKIGLASPDHDHFGLVFVFPQGMMLSELTASGTQFSTYSTIKSTCVYADIANIQNAHDLEPELLPQLMFSLHSPIWRNDFSWSTMSPAAIEKGLKDVRSITFAHKIVPEGQTITGADIIKMCDQYEAAHHIFIRRIDSCITFAHVVYRDILLA